MKIISWSYQNEISISNQPLIQTVSYTCHCLQIWQGAGWILSSSSCLAVLFATYSWSRGQSARPAEGIMYAILHRTVWAAGVAWVLFICATGHGGNINTHTY